MVFMMQICRLLSSGAAAGVPKKGVSKAEGELGAWWPTTGAGALPDTPQIRQAVSSISLGPASSS